MCPLVVRTDKDTGCYIDLVHIASRDLSPTLLQTVPYMTIVHDDCFLP